MPKDKGRYPGNSPKSGSNSIKDYNPKTTWGPQGGRPIGAAREYNPPAGAQKGKVLGQGGKRK